MPGLVDRCGVCGKQFSYSLQRCATCGKPACSDCAVRMARSVFCGKVCAHVFHFGGHEDVDEEDREDD